MEISIFDKIRSSCALVAEKSRYVKINHELISSYAQSLPLDIALNPIMDEANHFVGSHAETAAFFFILDSINFGSGYFPYLKRFEAKTGYFTVSFLLSEYFRKFGPLKCEQLINLTPEFVAEIFHQDCDCAEIMELMHLFSDAFRELGKFVSENFSGCFLDLLKSCNGKAEKLVRTLVQMPMYQDRSSYKGNEILFYKRAQIAVSDLAIAFKGESPGMFADVVQLTIFADNLVPHVLKMDGLLTFDKDLEARICNGILIPSGSEEEVEIRAVSLHAVELLKEFFISQGHVITSQGLDYLLWNRGQETFYREFPRHCTKTHFY
jgi:hypothetical protein